MPKWTAKIYVKYSVDVTIEAETVEDAQDAFGEMAETDGFSPEQLKPQGLSEIGFDGDVMCEDPTFYEKMD